MRLTLSLLAGLCLLASCNAPYNGKIQVTGQASLKVVPDMVELSLKAFSVRPAMKDAVRQTQADIDQILAVCHKYVHQEDDIKVSNVATDKDYDNRGRYAKFDGYSAQQILEVRLRNLRDLEPFMEELLATRINSIESLRYNHSKADSIQRVVNLMALTDAKKTAEKMCDQMNVGLGKVVFLSNYAPGGENTGSVQESGGDYELNLYSKSFGGRGFKMTAEILNFQDVAFAGFEIRQ